MVAKGWEIKKLDNILERVIDPVQVNLGTFYEEIGIRSHGKGIFHKAPILGATLGDKRVFWVKPDCFIVNIVFAWEQAVARTTKKEVGKIASHRFPMYRPKDGKADVDYLAYFLKHLVANIYWNWRHQAGLEETRLLGRRNSVTSNF